MLTLNIDLGVQSLGTLNIRQPQVHGLILSVVGTRHRNRSKNVERKFAIRLRIIDRLLLTSILH